MEAYWFFLIFFLIVLLLARRKNHEEEEMNPDLESTSGDWEYKILHGFGETYKDPEVMQQTLDEESQAGWTMFEKLDNRRLRLKRPVSARAKDASLDFDPYRCVSPSVLADTKARGLRNLKAAGVIVGLFFLVGLVAVLILNG